MFKGIGRETTIRIYCIQKFIFNKRKKGNKEKSKFLDMDFNPETSLKVCHITDSFAAIRNLQYK